MKPTQETLNLDELPGEAPFLTTVGALRTFLRAGLDAAKTRQWASGGLTIYAAGRVTGRAPSALLAAINRGFLPATRRGNGTWSIRPDDLSRYLKESEQRSHRRRGLSVPESDPSPAPAATAEPHPPRRRRADRQRVETVS